MRAKRLRGDCVITSLNALKFYLHLCVCVCVFMLFFYQVLICVHDERAGGKLHGASELGKPETQAFHL